MNPLLKILLDTRRIKQKTSRYPVKLRVTFGKEQKLYPVNIDLTTEEFNLVENPCDVPKIAAVAFKRQLIEWRMKCDSIRVKADKIINSLPDFTFLQLEKRLYKNAQSSTDVYQYYAETINKKRSNAKIGTAGNYQSNMNSLKEFSPKLKFRDITVEFLNDYENWLLQHEKSISTVGIYLRPLRAIVNEAISEGVISRDTHYAFGKGKYQIPAARNIKKALTKEEIKLIMAYNALPGTWWEKARDFFILSYLCNGINIKDIALLKYKNLDGDYIYFTRAKTQHTNRTSSTQISVYIILEARIIIERWKNTDTNNENFLFPILEPNITPEREQRLIQQFTKMVNK